MGGSVSFDSQGNITNWFGGIDVDAHVAAIFGLEVEVKLGQVPSSNFNKGTQDFLGEFVAQSTIMLNDKKVKSYLTESSEQMGILGDNLG